jgi:hypothetical protein
VRGLGEAVVIASGPQAFADAVMAAIQVPGDLATISARRAVAASRSWDVSAARFAAAIGIA